MRRRRAPRAVRPGAAAPVRRRGRVRARPAAPRHPRGRAGARPRGSRDPADRAARTRVGAPPVSARRALGAGTRRSRSRTGAGTAAGPGRPRRSAVARAGRGRRSPASSSTESSSVIVPSTGGSRPAIVETSVDLPEPFGPRSATVRPASASNAARTSNAPRLAVTSTASVIGGTDLGAPGSRRTRGGSGASTRRTRRPCRSAAARRRRAGASGSAPAGSPRT